MSLSELTIDAFSGSVSFNQQTALVGCLASLPRLRYLSFRTNCVLDALYTSLPPTITHLLLEPFHRQAIEMPDKFNFGLLPHLTHFHVRCRSPLSVLDISRWALAQARMKLQLGAAWCEKENDVVRWRADRVWQRSVGLPDEAEMYPA